MGRKVAISESFLSQIWRQQLVGREPMFTTAGKTVEVIYPGRATNDAGPDFRDALISINGGRPLQGDIELHVDARDWWTHGHHRDPNYDRVILHVAMRADGIPATSLFSGRNVPVLALSNYFRDSPDHILAELCQPPFGEEPCYQAFLRHGNEEISRVVEEAGDRRFKYKAQRFEAALAGHEPKQVLYEGMMRALGYSQNKDPFERLARLLPVSALQEDARREDHRRIQALMIGTAGLLPSQRSEKRADGRESFSNSLEAQELERIWTISGNAKMMNASEWRFHGIRPENSPPRRIVGMSHLLKRCRGELLQGILSAMNQISQSDMQYNLERVLTVRVEGYWASHSDFGVSLGWRPSLIGQGRARDIIVNVVLPFFLDWGHLTGQGWLQDLSVGLYHSHPRLEDNWITRHMKANLFGDEATSTDSARQQQGLIQLYDDFCTRHRCHDCPLGGGHAAGHGQPAGPSDLLDAETAQQPEQ